MKLRWGLLVIALVGLSSAVGYSDLGLMSIQVKEGQLRSTPSFLGAIVGPVSYGEPVEALQQQGDWLSIRSQTNLTGWLHQSALTKKRMVLGVGSQGASSGSTSQEIALAGKGFNADVESQFRRSHRGADFASVDRMETSRVSQHEMVMFLKEGALKPSEGGVR